jgi:hemolysin-activating ACP:hemolysin acyltransferase
LERHSNVELDQSPTASDARAVDQESRPREQSEKFLKSLDKAHLGAAASKRFSASIGDLALVLSRSPEHKHFSFADIEWMVLPPVAANQFYIVEAVHKEHGFRVPIAFVTWAFVSAETDTRLREGARQRARLRPDEWKGGDIAWLIDAVGNADSVMAGLRWLKSEPFKERQLNLITRDKQGVGVTTTLDVLLANQAAAGG